MTDYEVTWKIDVEADTYAEAARKALEIQRDPTSIATNFSVRRYGSEMIVDVDVSDHTVTTKEKIEVTALDDTKPRYADGEPLPPAWERLLADEGGRKNPRTELLADARAAVSRTEYGGPEKSFERIGELWTMWLAQRGYVVVSDRLNQYGLGADDVAVMLMLLKIARLMSVISHRDSIVDIAGYAACLAEIVQEGETS